MAKTDVTREQVGQRLRAAVSDSDYDPQPSMRRALDLCFEVPLGWLLDQCHEQIHSLRTKIGNHDPKTVGSMIAAEMAHQDQILCANLEKALWVALTYSHYRDWPKEKLAEWLGLSQS